MESGCGVSNLIDPMAQEFIYRRGLYLREPQDKPVLRTEDLAFLPCPAPESRTEQLLRQIFPDDGGPMLERLRASGDELLLLTDGVSGHVLGAASYRCLDSQHLFARLNDAALSAVVRSSSSSPWAKPFCTSAE